MADRRSSVNSFRPCRNQGCVLDPRVPARTLYCATTKEDAFVEVVRDGGGEDRPQLRVNHVDAERRMVVDRNFAFFLGTAIRVMLAGCHSCTASTPLLKRNKEMCCTFRSFLPECAMVERFRMMWCFLGSISSCFSASLIAQLFAPK